MVDFKTFKKVSENDDEAVLKNDDGHRIHLSKPSLKPQMLKQLAKLPLYQADPQEEVPAPSAEPEAAAAGAMGSTEAATEDQPAQAPEAEPMQEQPSAVSPDTQPSSNPFDTVPGYEEQSTAAGQTGEAEAETARKQANIMAGGVANESSAIDEAQRVLTQRSDELHKLTLDALKGHIDPNHYMESKSVPQRIGTAIGLLLGGISSGQTGQPNPAMTFLNNQIDRDLQSQRATLENKNNVLHALTQQYGDRLTAETMFKAFRANLINMQIQQAAAQSGSPIAKAQALNAQGALKQTYLPGVIRQSVIDQLNGRGAGGAAGAAAALDPATRLQLMLRGNLIDNTQFEQANKDLDVAEKTKAAHEAVDNLTDRLQKLQTTGSRVFNPIQSKQQINAAMAELSPLILASAPSKRYTPEAVKTLIEPFLGNFFTGRSTYEQLNQGMHRVIDTASDKPGTLQGLQNMGAVVPKYDATVQVRHPNGTIGKIPKAYLSKALKQGYQQVQ